MKCYTSFIEIISAFNFTFVASKTLSELFFEKIKKLIKELDAKKLNLQQKIALSQDFLDDNIFYNFYKIYDGIFKNIINTEKLDKKINFTENKLQKIFLLSGIYGVVLLFLAGQEEFYSVFPLTEIVLLNVGFMSLLIWNYFYLKSILTNIFNMMILLSISLLIGHSFDNILIKYNIFYISFFQEHSRLAINISLALTLSGFLLTLFNFGFKRFGISIIIFGYEKLFDKLDKKLENYIKI